MVSCRGQLLSEAYWAVVGLLNLVKISRAERIATEGLAPGRPGLGTDGPRVVVLGKIVIIVLRDGMDIVGDAQDTVQVGAACDLFHVVGITGSQVAKIDLNKFIAIGTAGLMRNAK